MDQSAKDERDKKYNLWARKMPTVICLVFPFSIFMVIAFSQDNITKDEMMWYMTKTIAWGGAVFTSLLFLMKAIIRDLSAILADNVFFNKFYRHFMYQILLKRGKGISAASYDKIVEYQKNKRGICIEDQGVDEEEKLKRVEDIVCNIKNMTRDDNIVFEYNCFYGFYRNLLGGSIISGFLVYVSSHMFNEFIARTNISITDYLYPSICIIFIISVIFMYYSDYKYAKKMYAAYLIHLDEIR